MSRRLMSLLLGFCLTLSWVSEAVAHDEPVIAEIVINPSVPAVDQDTVITVLLAGRHTKSPLLGANVRVWGDMTAHRMVPVKASLTPGLKPGSYIGTIAFPMNGEWLISLELDHLREQDSVQFVLEVQDDDMIARKPMLFTFDVFSDQNIKYVFAPWLVVTTTILLLSAMVVVARINWRGTF